MSSQLHGRSSFMRRSRWSGTAVLLLVGVLLAGCSSSGSGGGGTDALAKLAIIDSDALVKADGAAQFVSASKDNPLKARDGVRTNDTGFAEINYFDASLVRLDHDTDFTVVELSKADQAKVVKARQDNGASWHRVEKLGEKDGYSVDTPVGNAAVRGTAFAIDCTVVDQCTFMVFDGTVEVKTLDGTTVGLNAGESLTVKKNQKPPAVDVIGTAKMATLPWFVKNLGRDATRPGATTTTAAPSGAPTGTLPGGSPAPALAAPGIRNARFTGNSAIPRTVIESNNITAPVGTTERRTYTVTGDCTGLPCEMSYVSVNPDAPAGNNTADPEKVKMSADGKLVIDFNNVTDCFNGATGESTVKGGSEAIYHQELSVVDVDYRNGAWVATKLAGTMVLTGKVTPAGEAGGCAGAEIRPVTYSVEMVLT